jgi:cyclic pyranopterin phosphate synthase
MSFDGKNIVDRFGRVHDYLRISLTERCNLRCFYCMPEEGIPLRDKSEFMSAEELLNIVGTFVDLGIKKIRLTGGEPLLKKNFELILNELGQLPIELAITTNGILLDKYLDLLIKNKVFNINVSLDSLNEEKFNGISRRNYFQKIKENIDLLLQHDFNLKVNVVLMKGVNDDEIIDFIEWSRNSKIQIRFIEFMPFDGNNWNSEKKISQKEVLDLVRSHYGEENLIKIDDAPNDTARNFKIINSKGSFGIISSVTNPFCSTCNRIRLTADGKLKNCLFSQSETDLLSSLRLGEDKLEQLILDSIDSKYKERGGLDAFTNETVKELKNRSMVRIGG